MIELEILGIITWQNNFNANVVKTTTYNIWKKVMPSPKSKFMVSLVSSCEPMVNFLIKISFKCMNCIIVFVQFDMTKSST